MQYGIPKNFTKGIGDMFANLAGGGSATRQKAYDSEVENILKRQLNQAKIADYRSKIQDRGIRGRSLEAIPGVMAGVPDLQASQLGDYMASGQWQIPEEMTGPMRPGMERPWELSREQPDWATPDVMQRYADGRRLQQVVGASTSANPMQIMQAMGLGDMMAGRLDPSQAAGMYGASMGKPIYNQGAQGILNQYTGGHQETQRSLADAAKNIAAAEANQALAGQRQSAAGYYDARAQTAGQGKTGATQNLIQFYMGQGMDFQQAQNLVNEAKWNPRKATVDLAKAIINNVSRIQGQRTTPELAMQQAEQLIMQLQAENSAQPAPVAPGAPGPAIMDDPLGLFPELSQ